jgi:hypothetical protein
LRSSILVSEDEIRDVLDMVLFTDFDWGGTCRVATRKLWMMLYTMREPQRQCNSELAHARSITKRMKFRESIALSMVDWSLSGPKR